MQLPMRDSWSHRCTLRRRENSTDADFVVTQGLEDVLVNEPCAVYRKSQQVLTDNGLVWRRVPRLAISPVDTTKCPKTDDVIVMDGHTYRITDVDHALDFDGSYMGTYCNLFEVGVAE